MRIVDWLLPSLIMETAKAHSRWSVVMVMMGCWTPAVASIKVPPALRSTSSAVVASSKDAGRLLVTVQLDPSKCCPHI